MRHTGHLSRNIARRALSPVLFRAFAMKYQRLKSVTTWLMANIMAVMASAIMKNIEIMAAYCGVISWRENKHVEMASSREMASMSLAKAENGGNENRRRKRLKSAKQIWRHQR